METLLVLLVVTAVREQHLAFLAHQLPMLVVAVALQIQPLELAVQEGGVLALLELAMELLERQTQVAVVAAQEITQVLVAMVLLAVLVLSFCPYQQTNIREQPQVLRRSQQAGQTPS
jgi:hypothetical protein